MTAHLIAEHKIANVSQFDEYRGLVAPMIERFGGRYLTRPGTHKILDGAWQPGRTVIIELPDMAALHAWYASPEYQPLIAMRRGAAVDVLIAVQVRSAPASLARLRSSRTSNAGAGETSNAP